jgi:haloacetate dehalogenase
VGFGGEAPVGAEPRMVLDHRLAVAGQVPQRPERLRRDEARPHQGRSRLTGADRPPRSRVCNPRPMFEGFVVEEVEVGATSLFVRHGGSGPVVVLLHGHPRTSATWHRVAPQLVAAGATVVCPDLPGYGRSGKPEPEPDHAPHSKRAMAMAVVELMDRLGHERFSVAGHDRGSYVALRLALDHPGRVERVALIDCVPISEHLARIDAAFAVDWWHWFFFAQPEIPERVIGLDPDAWYPAEAEAMGQENYDEMRAATRDPATVRAMLEDYRAGLTVDRVHEEADRAAGRKIQAPTLVLWSTRDDLPDRYGDPLAIWNDWAVDIRAGLIDSGHHVAEEAPDDLAAELIDFFITG